MFVFEEVITCSAEAKTQLSQYACNFPPNHKGGLMAKYELCPLGRRICPSTKLVVGLMNSQCYRDNPFSSNLSLRSLGGPKKMKPTLLYYFTGRCFQATPFVSFLCFFGGGGSTVHLSYPDLPLYCLLKLNNACGASSL